MRQTFIVLLVTVCMITPLYADTHSCVSNAIDENLCIGNSIDDMHKILGLFDHRTYGDEGITYYWDDGYYRPATAVEIIYIYNGFTKSVDGPVVLKITTFSKMITRIEMCESGD
jgi:hypothetical protein